MSLLEEAKLRSEIKRINTRIAAIGKRFGKDSEVYKETIKGFINGEASKFTSISKSGYVKLRYNIVKSKSKTAQKVFNIGKKVKTLTEIKKETVNELKKTGELKNVNIEKVDVNVIYKEAEKIANIKSDFTSWLESMYREFTDSELIEEYPELFEKRGKRLTYAELSELMERDTYGSETPFD